MTTTTPTPTENRQIPLLDLVLSGVIRVDPGLVREHSSALPEAASAPSETVAH